MIVGSGLIAGAFVQGGAQAFDDTCFYAAGVSNSGCNDEREYLRERTRLEQAIAACFPGDGFVYFSTCSIEDPAMRDSAYVQHKLRMEDIVRACPRHLILRLPQVAGRTPNPHTLLNYLHARIARSERFHVWGGATRNIIDVEDVVRITLDLISTEGANAETINVASTHSFRMLDIVRAMERALEARAVFDILDRSSGAQIDVARIAASIRRCGIAFGNAYLDHVVAKYYGAYDMDAVPGFRPYRPAVFPVAAWQR
jgi:nucleoside-diphosphate-sugar epimerase